MVEHFNNLMVHFHETTTKVIDGFSHKLHGIPEGEESLSGGENIDSIRQPRHSSTQELNSDQDALNILKEELVGKSLQRRPPRFNQPDEWIYTVTIICMNQDSRIEPSHSPARAMLDTGSHDNWVSRSIINRAGLEWRVAEVDVDGIEATLSFTGEKMTPQGLIELTWFMTMPNMNGQQTNSAYFYVYEELPVDLVLGKAFIKQKFTLVSKYALGKVKQGSFTRGKLLNH